MYWLVPGATWETGAWENGEVEQPARLPTSAKIPINFNILEALRPDIAVTLAWRNAQAIDNPRCPLFACGARQKGHASCGGRNTTSCLAESATTSGGLCSFMPWIAQNKS
jgi:hypothetical protein